jgi:hypothetical protein
MLEKVLFWLQNNLNWRLVRGIAELRILTKASYLMLLIVPLLAAMWPTVRVTVNQYNKMAMSSNRIALKAKADLDSCTRHIDDKIRQLKADANSSPEFAKEILERARLRNAEIATMINDHKDEYFQKTLDQPKFPKILAMAFFAALFIGLGHLLYEIGAPEQLKNRNFEEFISYRKEDYDSRPSNISMDRAKDYLTSSRGMQYTEQQSRLSAFQMRRLERALDQGADVAETLMPLSTKDLKEFWNIFESLPILKTEYPLLYDAIQKRGEASVTQSSKESNRLRDLSTIEQGAQVEYLVLASRNVHLIVLVAGLYLTGIILLAEIVYKQSSNILVK